MTREQRLIVFNKYGGRCAYTGRPLGDDWQVDHITPVFQYRMFMATGNPNDIVNLVPALKIVNHYKRAKDLAQFRTYISTLHERIAKLPKTTRTIKTFGKKKYMLEIASAFDITHDKPFTGLFYFETYKP